MIKTLRRKFIIIAMGSVFAVLAIIIGVINVINYVNVVNTADGIVSVLQEGGGDFGGKEFLPGAGNKFTSETPYETRFFTVIIGSNGSVGRVNISQIAAVGANDAAGYAEELYSKGRTSGFYGNYRYGTTGVGLGDTMYIFVDCTKELSSFNNFLLASIIVGFAGLMLVFGLVCVLSGRVMKPVAESYDKQKRFITDASHEIKTPLTIISADAEVLEMQDGGNEWTGNIKEQVARLTSLTEKLVFLARMDEDGRKINAIDFCISDAVEEAAQSFNAVALSRGIELKTHICRNLTYCGDEAMIRQVVCLLVDNALKYCDGDSVEVALEPSGNRLSLTVKNRASYMNGENPELLFERFYRSDRSRNSETGGSGVGLSVVQAIVNAHKGKISARKEGENAVFTVIL